LHAAAAMNKTPTVPAPSLSPMSASSPADTTTVKTEGKKRHRTVDPVDREAKARERTLRNRAAAQLSREKKRRYVEELESANTQLKRDNASLAGRLSGVEADNRRLTCKLEAVTVQLSAMQSQMSFLASLAACRNGAATAAALPLAQSPPSPPSPPRSLSTPMLCSDAESDIDSDGRADEALSGNEVPAVDFAESAALDKLARERRANSLQRKLTAGSSYPSWLTRSARPILSAHPPACKETAQRPPPRPCLTSIARGRIRKCACRRRSHQPPAKTRPCCRITRQMARLTFSLVLWTLSSSSRLCNRQKTTTSHGTTRRLPTLTPTSFCPTTSNCSTPRLFPLPRRFIPYFENHDRTMDREVFRRMVAEWIWEMRMIAHLKLLGTLYRPSTDGDASPR